LEHLPLGDVQPAVRKSLYDLILILVQQRLETEQRSACDELAAWLDRAALLATPTKSFYRLRAECCGRAGDASGAAEARRQMQDPRTDTTALDHFLQAEAYRTQLLSPTNPHLDPLALGTQVSLYQRALEEYRLALQQEPRHFWAHLQLGRCYLALGRGEEAVQILGTCVALHPESPWGYNARGAALVQLGRQAEAERELLRLVEEHPDFLPARLNLGRSFQLSGKLDAALAEYAKVLSAPAERRLIAAAYYRGEVFLQQNKLAEALEEFCRVVAEDPGFYPVYLVRSQAHFAQGRDTEGLEDLNRFLLLTAGEVYSADWQMHHRRGAFLRLLHTRLPQSVPQRRQAVLGLMLEELRAAVAKGGRSAELYDDLGAALDMSGLQAEAVAQYSAGLKLADGDSQIGRKLQLKRGWANLALGNAAAAAEDFQSVRNQAPVAEANTGLGYLDALRMQTDAALQHALDALLLAGDDYLVLHNVACIYATLSQNQTSRQTQYEDMALAVMRRAVARWNEQGRPVPSALELIQAESAFPASLRDREEFR
jgi:tetratricopeptide (TPR) repeat protein